MGKRAKGLSPTGAEARHWGWRVGLIERGGGVHCEVFVVVKSQEKRDNEMMDRESKTRQTEQAIGKTPWNEPLSGKIRGTSKQTKLGRR